MEGDSVVGTGVESAVVGGVEIETGVAGGAGVGVVGVETVAVEEDILLIAVRHWIFMLAFEYRLF